MPMIFNNYVNHEFYLWGDLHGLLWAKKQIFFLFLFSVYVNYSKESITYMTLMSVSFFLIFYGFFLSFPKDLLLLAVLVISFSLN